MESAAGARGPAWLPGSSRRIVLASASDAGAWEASAVVELAELVARDRSRTLLVNTVTGDAGPDSVLRPEGGPGLADVVSGRSRAADVAFTPRGRSFIAIPAGESSPGLAVLSRAPAFRHLVSAAGRGGTLLLHVSETDLAYLARTRGSDLEGLELDGLVLLGGASAPRNLPAGIRVLARVEPEARSDAASPSGAPASRRASGFSRPTSTPAIIAGSTPRNRPRTRVERVVDELRRRGATRGIGGVAAVWFVAVLAVWLVWQGLSGWPAFEDDPAVPTELSAVHDSPATVVSGRRDEAEAAAPALDRAGEAAALPTRDDRGAGATAGQEPVETPPVTAGPEVDLPYSILVSSVVTYDDAAAKRDEVTDLGGLAFIAPTPVKGRVYYRVFGGALQDREQAREYMRRLVEQKVKERERDWDMRPVRFALALGDFPTENEANVERDRLHEAGVPAYVLPVRDTTGAIFRLYSGAFESETAAGPADSMLAAAGHPATLVTRRGEPR